MIVIADTSPINYLVLIDAVDILPRIFDRVLIPKAVLTELQQTQTPEKVRAWRAHLPAWMEINSIRSTATQGLMNLGMGEREAILLALETGADLVLIDELRGRKAAQSLRIQVRGTIGILEHAAHAGMIDLRVALNKLDQTNFRISQSIREDLLRRNP